MASIVMSSRDDVRGLLVAWGEGDRAARSELMELVYTELKSLAKAYLRDYANQPPVSPMRDRQGYGASPGAAMPKKWLRLRQCTCR